MKLTRRQRRELAALGQQLVQDDPGLAEQLSRPGLRRARTHAGVVIGRVMFVLGLLMVLGGDLLSASTAVTLGAIVLLTSWVPWQYGSDSARR